MPERKVWWHNLRSPADVDLSLAGEHVRARAVVVEGAERPDDAARAAVVVRADLTGSPDH